MATATFGFVVPLSAYLIERGIAPALVFDRIREEWPDVDFETGGDLNRRIPLDAVARLLESAAEVADDRAFGAKYALAFPEGTSGVYGHVMLTASTVREMLEHGIKFVELSISPINVGCGRVMGGNRYTIDLLTAGRVPYVQFAGFILSVLLQRIRRAAGPAWMPAHVGFVHREPEPEALAEYHRRFGPYLEFDLPLYEFVVQDQILDLPNPTVLPGLQETVLGAATKLLAEHKAEAENFVGEVRRALLSNMRDDRLIQLGIIARDLGISTRTLQLRLKRHETTFEQVLSNVRMELAMELLRDSSLPLGIISGRLGFSEPSAFTRWASGRFDMTPSELRQRLRDERDVPPLTGNNLVRHHT
jgi:AraC-like DNA-binding protein